MENIESKRKMKVQAPASGALKCVFYKVTIFYLSVFYKANRNFAP